MEDLKKKLSLFLFSPPKLFVFTNRYLLMSCKGTLMLQMFISIKEAAF